MESNFSHVSEFDEAFPAAGVEGSELDDSDSGRGTAETISNLSSTPDDDISRLMSRANQYATARPWFLSLLV